MKLYLPDIKPRDMNNKSILNKLNELISYQKDIISIQTEEGLYEIDNTNTLYKLAPVDISIDRIHIDKNSVWLDKSYYKKQIEYQIPTKHLVKKYRLVFYLLRKNALLQLVFVYNNSDMIDVYFSTKESIDVIKEDFLTFLSMIN